MDDDLDFLVKALSLIAGIVIAFICIVNACMLTVKASGAFINPIGCLLLWRI